MTISKSQLKKLITEAVNELQHAWDKHNCGSDRIKIYINEEGDLYHTIQQSNSTNQGHTEILRFEYSRPTYESTTQEMLDESEFTGTIAEWDWEIFYTSSDIDNYIERLLYECIDNCREREIEVY